MLNAIFSSGARQPGFKNVLWLTLIGFYLYLSYPAHATADFCIPSNDPVTGVPTIDGKVDGDIGWGESTRLNLGVITGVENSVISRILKDNSSVYLSFEVTALGPNNTEDMIVLAISPDAATAGTPANDWLIHIFPFGPAGQTNENPGLENAPYSVLAWRNSSSWATIISVALSDWLYRDVRIWKDGSSNNWSIEIKIPQKSSISSNLSDGIHFNPGGTFGLYMNVIRTVGGIVSNTATQSPWPVSAQLTNGQVKQAVPLWADGSLDSRPACTGISLAWDQTGTTHVPMSKMLLYQPGGNPLTSADCPPDPADKDLKNSSNTFFAKPGNNSGVTMNQVSARYMLANWGIPPLASDQWSDVPAGSNNPTPFTNVPPNPVPSHLFNMVWEPTYEQSCNYLLHPHQCMLVILESPDPNTRFLNESVRRNMDFVTASKFERDATVSGKGYGEPAGGANSHRFLLSVNTKTRRYSRGDDRRSLAGPIMPIPPPKETIETMTWIARGYKNTDHYLIIQRDSLNSKRFELVEEVGGFGYLAQHVGSVRRWKEKITGEGVEQLADGLYSMRVPAEGELTIRTTIEAKPKRLSLSLHAGKNYPIGDIDNIYNGDLSANLDLSWSISPVFSAELLLGYHSFKLDSLDEKLNLYQIAGNLKYVFSVPQRWKPFICGGGGLYQFESDSSKFGYNIGVGVKYKICPKVDVEGVYNYHSIMDTHPSFYFSSLQAVIRYWF